MSDEPKKPKAKLIQPRTLKGFRDFLPESMMPREKIMEQARRVYRRFGFNPIDTPVLEYLEILTGKGSEETDRQLYNFRDHGDRAVGMRFDLTVPLARFAAQHIPKLGTPFKRYHIAPVWRGEAPQAGRYREFMQCDFDTIGTQSVVSDIETGLVIHELLLEIGITNFTIRINNRQVLSGLLEKLDLSAQAVPILRSLDKLDKIGPEAVSAEMQNAAGIDSGQAEQVLKLAAIAGSADQVLQQVETLVQGNDLGETGVGRLRELSSALLAAGVPEDRFKLDVAIARGLDYYTGVIFETTLDDLPSIGSICSGGRYDNLAGLYTKQHLPGIGASLGLDRLLAAMETLDMIEKVNTPAEVFIPYFDRDRLHEYLQLAAAVRSAGIGAEVYPDAKRLGQQLKYADSRGFQVALVAGSDELDAGNCGVKNLATKETAEVPWRDNPAPLIDAIRACLKR
ncbi:MAG: histidine--tRNA ligase [Planctomycetota bacterium]